MSETQSESPKTRPRVYVDFKEAKRLVTVPDVLAACDLLERFERRGETLSGVCPLPSHRHGPYPNPEQWKARVRDGLWLWHCFGDCQRGGDSIELAKLLLGLSNEHVRLWLAEHFGDRLTLKRPQGRSRDRPPDEGASRSRPQKRPARKRQLPNGPNPNTHLRSYPRPSRRSSPCASACGSTPQSPTSSGVA